MREEGERTGNKKMVYKYSPESPRAIDLIKDLKRRVQATEDKVCTEFWMITFTLALVVWLLGLIHTFIPAPSHSEFTYYKY